MMISRMATFTSIILALSISTAHAAVLDRRQYGTYTLRHEYSGDNFFSGFSAFTAADPTRGHVQYVSLQNAASSRMLGHVIDAATNSKLAYLAPDSVNIAPNGRQSIRLEGVHDIGVNSIVVADIKHMPTGCGLWSAFWLLGGNDWPASGEIDIVESVHESNYNTMTLHTSPGCHVNSSPTNLFQGALTTGDCNANTAYDGCSVIGRPTASFAANQIATAGDAFNKQGGGVYVAVWTTAGISVYLIPRGSQPADLLAGRPNPASWGFAPVARFTGGGCDYTRFFRNMRIVINTDFCGTWAGQQSIWESSGCRAKTKVATCQDYVANHPQDFRDNASWLFQSIKVYSI